MVRLSIIIPAVGSQRDLEDTLVSVLSNRPQDCEVLVVFAGPYDDPYDLRDEVRVIETDVGTHLIGLANAGIKASQGEVLHLLGTDIEVVEGWSESPMRCFDRDPSVAAVSPLVVAAEDRCRIVSTGVRYTLGGRRKVTGFGGSVPDIAALRGAIDGPTLSAGFYRQSAVVSAGGLDSFVGGQFADVDLAINLQELGYGCLFEPNCRIFSHQATARSPRVGFQQARFAERFFWRHRARRGRLPSLLLHSAHVVIDSLSQLPRPSSVTGLAGRLTAMWDVVRGKHRRPVSIGDKADDLVTSAERIAKRKHFALREAG